VFDNRVKSIVELSNDHNVVGNNVWKNKQKRAGPVGPTEESGRSILTNKYVSKTFFVPRDPGIHSERGGGMAPVASSICSVMRT